MSEKFYKLGILGWPLGYSLSPLIQQRALAQVGRQGEYREYAVPSEEIWPWLDRVSVSGLDGFNVTIPYKRSVFDWIIGIGQGQMGQPEEAWIGAVNTVEMRDGCPIGWNTDAAGFSDVFNRPSVVERLPKGFGLKGRSAVLLGAGGSARAVAFELIWHQEVGELVIWNHHSAKAEELAQDMRQLCQQGSRSSVVRVVERVAAKDLSGAALLVNTVPVSDEMVLDPRALRQGLVVYDLVYSPPWTTLLRAAKRSGAVVISGLEMLASQAALAFHFWLREDARGANVRPVMIEALKEKVGNQWPS